MELQEDKAKSIFLNALDISSQSERSEYVKKQCDNDNDLRAEVDELLFHHPRIDKFLEQPAVLPQTDAITEITEKPGDKIGNYKLLEQIGEGGMGIVYMADQTEPVKRRVALKIIKPGMDTKQVIARFEAERQVLAIMDHPNIAKVLDAGATSSPLSLGRGAGYEGKEETSPLSLGRGAGGEGEEVKVAGRPYFVMELVRGIPITEYCDKQKLTTTERLKLFITVCKAVQHAHQKGIIHRDIKPSNILVTIHDDVAVPKVIDFGVAKAINRELTEQTLFTNFAMIIGTPLYMSPEQAEMTSLDIDTRSDIYSLGVLLYELLTGSTPFEKEKMKQAGYDEMRRIIREDEPPNPSARISTLGAMITTVSEKRSTDPRKLSATVRGDLDWIVMKALEKDRIRRYETANAFAADIERYLKDEPVEACPPSAAYKFRKFARRNKAALATAAVVAATLVVGSILTTWQAIRATQAEQVAAQDRDRALEAEKRAEANLRLAFRAVDEMYTDVAGEHLADKPHMTPLQRDVLEKALKFYQEFARDNITDSDVQQETAKAYRRVGDIRSKLGQHPQAEEAYNEAIALLEKLANDFPGQPDYRKHLAVSYNNLGVLLKNLRRFKESENAHQEALRLRNKLMDGFPDVPEYREYVAQSYNNLGLVLLRMGQVDDAENADRKAIDLRKQLVEEFPTNANYQSTLAGTLNNLAILLTDQGELSEAAQLLEEAILHQRAALDSDPEHMTYRNFLSKHYFHSARVLVRQKEYVEAERAYGQDIALMQKLASDFPDVPKYRKDVAGSYNNLGILLALMGRPEEAQKADRQAIDLQKQLVDEFPNNADYQSVLGGTLSNLATVLSDRSELAQARQLLEDAIIHQRAALDFDAENVTYRKFLSKHYFFLAQVLVRQKEFVEAEHVYGQDITVMHKLASDFPSVPEYRAELATSYDTLGLFLTKLGRLQEAEKAFDRAITIKKKLIDKFPNVADYQSKLGATFNNLTLVKFDRGELSEACELLEQAIHRQRSALESDPQHPRYRLFLRNHYASLAEIRVRLRQHVQAAKAAKELPRIYPDSWEEYHRAARFLARCVQLAEKDTKLAEDERNELAHTYAQRAKELLREAAGRIPDKPAAQNELAWYLGTCPEAQVRDPGRAVELAQKAVAAAPQEGNYWNTLGVAYCRAGEWNEAIAALEKSMELSSGGSAYDWLFLAMIEWRLDNKQKAREWYDKSVRWMEERHITSPELIRFRDEAANLLGLEIPRPIKMKLPLVAPRPRKSEPRVSTSGSFDQKNYRPALDCLKGSRARLLVAALIVKKQFHRNRITLSPLRGLELIMGHRIQGFTPLAIN